MVYRKQLRKSVSRRKKIADGQISLVGDIYNFKLKYQPHQCTVSDTGETVFVVRIPLDASDLDRTASLTELHKMASEYKPHFKKDFWRDKARDARREQGLKEAELDDNFTT